MVFALKRKHSKALQYEKKHFPYFQFVCWIADDHKYTGTKPEKPGGKQWL